MARVASVCLATLAMTGCAVFKTASNDHDTGSDSAALANRADTLAPAPAVAGDRRARLAAALRTIYADRAGPENRYTAAFVSLDGQGGDGPREAVVYVYGPDECARGCDLYIFRQAGQRFEAVNRIPNARPPLDARPAGANGWRPLTTGVAGPTDTARQSLRYTGAGYTPVDDKPADTATARILIPALGAGGDRFTGRLAPGPAS